MRLITRHEVSAEFRIPVSSVDERMGELKVIPYLPSKKGRGYHVLYDAEEIIEALKNERDRKQAIREKRRPRICRRTTPDIFNLTWKEAQRVLAVREGK